MTTRRIDAEDIFKYSIAYHGFRPCEVCKRHIWSHYWVRFDEETAEALDCSNNERPKWKNSEISVSLKEATNFRYYCNIPFQTWTNHAITVNGQTYEFERNTRTGMVHAPGVVAFSTESLSDAEEILRSVYGCED